jgi:hypothetical protein
MSTPSTHSWSGILTAEQAWIAWISVIPVRSAAELEACWVEGLKLYAPDDSVWRAERYCGGPGFWQSHMHGKPWQQLWEEYGDSLVILGPSLAFRLR